MAISTVRVQLNGVWHNLTLNTSTGKWEATVTAPSVTSYNLTGHYYPVVAEATNQAGTKTTVNAQDAALGASLRLVVKEKVKPVVTITGPAAGAYISNNSQSVTVQLRDEAGGSGVDISTLSFKIDGVTYTNASAQITSTAVTNGYNVTFTPSSAMADGQHNVEVQVSDFDGNRNVAVTSSFTVDTVPPTLSVTAPVNGLITAVAAVNVTGTTNDATSSPVTLSVKLNGTDQGAVTVGADGSFSKTVTLVEGENTIEVKAVDKAGKSTTVTRKAVLDTTSPQFVSATINPNPADAGATVIISVEVE